MLLGGGGRYNICITLNYSIAGGGGGGGANYVALINITL